VNCLLYLVDTEDLVRFKASLESIPARLKGYPILAYHEASLTEEARRELKEAHPQLQFHEIDLTRPRYPDSIDANIPDEFVMDVGSFGLGYRSMCRFFSGELFERPELQPYEYALRLDTDSAILDMTFDPFEVMSENGADYGYRLVCNDHPQCYEYYYEHFRYVLRSFGHPYALRKEEEGNVYYTNFEVFRLDAFRTPLHRSVYSEMERTGGFYLHRWGDHIHRYAFVRQFGLKVTQMVFGYRHGNQDFTEERELFLFERAGVAQSVEQPSCKLQVVGSSPTPGSTL